MGQTKQQKAAMLRRRETVADLYVQGWKQADIARQVGVSQPTVSYDLRAIQREWLKSSIRDFDILRERELKKLDKIEREAWDAWQQSKKPAQTATINVNGGTQRTQKKVEDQTGDPRYLSEIQKCISNRSQLLGLNSPAKVSCTSPDGTEAYHTYVMSKLMELAEGSKDGPDVIDGQVLDRMLLEKDTVDDNKCEPRVIDARST